MRRASSISEFVADPVGAWCGGATYVVWCASPTLCGSSHWGRPSERDIRELTQIYEIAKHPELTRFDVFMDDAAIEFIDWSVLAVLSDYLRTRLTEWGERIGKQVVVMPPGIVAAVLAGVVPLIGPTYPMRFVSTRGAALDWLARPEMAALLEEVDQLVTDLRGVAQVVRELRAYLDGDLAHADIQRAARALQRSRRSLQRELSDAGTGFAVEVVQARVRHACTLLANSDDKVEAIARRVGCGGASHLGLLFRRALGETPMAYRRRHRD